jgi:hypothetical protein
MAARLSPLPCRVGFRGPDPLRRPSWVWTRQGTSPLAGSVPRKSGAGAPVGVRCAVMLMPSPVRPLKPLTRTRVKACARVPAGHAALRSLRRPFWGSLRAMTTPLRSLGRCAVHVSPSSSAMSATARWVGRSLHALHQQAMSPLGDQATAHPDRGGNGRSRPRRAPPTTLVGARCHARSIRRATGVRCGERGEVSTGHIETSEEEEGDPLSPYQ